MAIRSLTESFTFMRNNAFQNRSFYRDDKSDQESLVTKSKSKGIEKTSSEKFRKEWQNTVNSLQYTFSMIRQKMKEVISLHDRHLMASNLDDNLDEDQEIELQTKELTQLFNLSHSQLGQLSKLRRSSSMWQESQESKLAENVLCNLARTLQDLSVVFRKAQSEYLNKLRSRDERIRSYLNIDLNLGDTSSPTNFVNEVEDNEYALWESQKQRRSVLLTENTNMVVQREQEIHQIVQSIHELNEIFRDVAQMVVDQGTFIDRIDYNVEHTQIRVEQGLKQLTKAQSHQSKDRKMIVILVLSGLVIVFGVLLIVTKLR
ncbi:hypothetical protein MN116_007854 [Schistosoma mekongi]|uniref:t-SNARE coiled-coil homology domain-containing protein n=1 Tax=Schistosoma mekongi TaxID=38744 RepID=A0AAE2D2C2_SCHME|nr:hypothetical protein MN116_007854 [Schistosoma mekongi]